MSEWCRTSLIEANDLRIESALDYVAVTNGMEKVTFAPDTISMDLRDELWESPRLQVSSWWVIAIRSLNESRCMVKTAPQALMAEYTRKMTTRPLIACICSLLSCEGIYFGREDSEHLFIEVGRSGDFRVSGMKFEEQAYLWPFQEQSFKDPQLTIEDRDQTLLDLFSGDPGGDYIGNRELMLAFDQITGGAQQANSDFWTYDMLCDRSGNSWRDWRIACYTRDSRA